MSERPRYNEHLPKGAGGLIRPKSGTEYVIPGFIKTSKDGLKEDGNNEMVAPHNEVDDYPGKKKCKTLREIRRKIAEANNIIYEPVECNHVGDCKGTCEFCDIELDYINRMIKAKKKNGEEVILTGIAEADILDLGDVDMDLSQEEDDATITLPNEIAVDDFANRMHVMTSEVVEKLFLQGVVVTVSQEIDFETAEKIAKAFGYAVQHQVRVITLEDEIAVKDLARKLDLYPSEVIKGFENMGKQVNLYQTVDFESASQLAARYHFAVRRAE